MLEKLKRIKEEVPRISPYVNMYQQNNNIILAVEMPGVDKKTMDVHIEGNQLLIRGTKKQEEVAKEYKCLYQERRPVEYERKFEINTHIDTESIKAEYRDGILKIILAKSEEARPKKIEIKT